MIRFENVTKRYQAGPDALAEVSFGIEAGEVVFVTGHSGAGKSTLLKLVSLAERPTRGRITVNHRELARVRRRGVPQHRRGIGMVFQDHRLLMDRSVFDNVALPLLICSTPRDEIGRRVRARSSCFSNLCVTHELCRNVLIADVPAIVGSLDIVMGEIDR